jgi:hypothetical protein
MRLHGTGSWAFWSLPSFVVVVLAVVVVVAFMGGVRVQPARAAAAPPTTKPSNADLAAEACSVVRENFFQHWSPVSGSWVSFVRGSRVTGATTMYLEERKGLKAIYDPLPLTTADRLNGIEWKGSVYLQSEARRQYYFEEEAANGIGLFHAPAKKRGWTDWESVEKEKNFWVYNVQKRDGQWKLEKP